MWSPSYPWLSLLSGHVDATQRQSQLSLVMKYLSSCEYALDLSIASKQKYVFMRIMNSNNNSNSSKNLTGWPSYQLALTVTHQFILLYRTHAHQCNYDLYWFVYTRFPPRDIHTFFSHQLILALSLSVRTQQKWNCIIQLLAWVKLLLQAWFDGRTHEIFFIVSFISIGSGCSRLGSILISLLGNVHRIGTFEMLHFINQWLVCLLLQINSMQY